MDKILKEYFAEIYIYLSVRKTIWKFTCVFVILIPHFIGIFLFAQMNILYFKACSFFFKYQSNECLWKTGVNCGGTFDRIIVAKVSVRAAGWRFRYSAMHGKNQLLWFARRMQDAAGMQREDLYTYLYR